MQSKEDIVTQWFAQQAQLDPSQFPIGIGDDMAEIQLAEGVSVLITTDMLIDGVHFDLSQCTLEQAGYKAMAASLSDCAAMATIPVAAVGAVALPDGFGEKELKELHAGRIRAGKPFDCQVVGGDITKWKSPDGKLAICFTILSHPSGHHPPVRRSGAQVGDLICVTGTLGGSILHKHLDFTPRIKEALEITKRAHINSMMDITDGLSTDLNRICAQSGVGAILQADMIPYSAAAQETGDPIHAALHDGEDFELLFTLNRDELNDLSGYPDVAITHIGYITDQSGMQIKMPGGKTLDLEPKGFDHL
jgi:thiamine-monophosphate kinase